MPVIQNQRFRPNGEVPPPAAAATKATGSGARKPARKAPPPVTAHRLFPAVVGLWFAALFGIGSFVVPPTLFESVVSATGLPSVLPAAAPPLGFTARALLALVLTFAGGLAGLMIGLRFARASAPVAQRKTFPGQPVRAAAPAGRRAGFKAADAAAEDAAPSVLPPAGPATRAPLRASETFAGIEPLGTPSTTDLHDFTRDQAFSAPVAHPERSDPEHSETPDFLGSFATPPAEEDATFEAEATPPAPFAAPAPFGTPFPATVSDEAVEPMPADFAEPADAPEPDAPAADPATVLERARRGELNNADALIRSPLAQLGTVQLIERLAMAMADWRNRVDEAAMQILAPAAAMPPVAALVPAEEASAAPFAPDPAQLPPVELAPFALPAADAALPEMPVASALNELPAEPMPIEPPVRPALFDSPVAGPAQYDWGDDEDEPALPPRFLSSAPETPRPALAAFEPRFAVEALDDETDCAAEPDSTDEDDTICAMDDAPGADDPAAEDGDPYPSLLRIGQPLLRTEPRRQPLLPEADAPTDFADTDDRFAQPAPSVMAPFSQPGANFAAMPAPQSGPTAGLPVAAPAHPVEPIDPVEADLALRTALANLQRMSGGAR